MTDFIHFPPLKRKKKVLITESTKQVVEKAIGENIEDLNEDEMIQKINESKKAVAKKTKKGIKVKQSLNG